MEKIVILYVLKLALKINQHFCSLFSCMENSVYRYCSQVQYRTSIPGTRSKCLLQWISDSYRKHFWRQGQGPYWARETGRIFFKPNLNSDTTRQRYRYVSDAAAVRISNMDIDELYFCINFFFFQFRGVVLFLYILWWLLCSHRAVQKFIYLILQLYWPWMSGPWTDELHEKELLDGFKNTDSKWYRNR